MPTKCILVSKEELLLGSIVEELLTHNDTLDLTEIRETSQKELFDALEQIHPEVLIICHKTHYTLPIEYLQILQRFPDLLIITISSDDNYMHIYNKQKVLMRQSSDLLSVIQSH